MLKIHTMIFIFLFVPLYGLSAAPSECVNDIEGTVKKAEEGVALLKVANLKGDLKMASERVGDLEILLKGCPKEILPIVCGLDCHYQQGLYYQFAATASLYLPEVTSETTFNPERSQTLADKATEILEEGIHFLNLRQKESSLREFTENLIKLQKVRIETYMLMGDFWYQTISQHALKKLDYSVNKTLKNYEAGRNVNWGRANMYYRLKALPAIIDSLTDIPSDNTFDGIRSDIQTLHFDLQKRLNSIEKGKLFLDMDPNEFTAVDFRSLKESLTEDLRRMKEVEEKIHIISQNWFRDKTSTDLKQIDEDRYQNSQKVSLAIHNIGKMEAESRKHVGEIQKLRLDNQKSANDINYKRQLRSLEVDLERRMKEFEYKQKLITSRRESDLVGLDEKLHSEKRNEMRWLMSWKISEMNIDLQLHSFETQLAEYTRQYTSNQKNIDEIKISISQKVNAIEINNLRIAEIDQKMGVLDKQQNDIFHVKQSIIREDICKIENELAFTGYIMDDSPFRGENSCIKNRDHYVRMNEMSFLKAMCGENRDGLKYKINNLKIDNINHLVGLNAQEMSLFKSMYQNQKTSLENQLKSYEQVLIKSQNTFNEIKKYHNVSSIESWIQSVLSAASSILVTSYSPRTTVNTGLNAGTSTEIPTHRIIKAAFDVAKITADWQFSLHKIKYLYAKDSHEYEKLFLEIERQMQIFRDELNSIKLKLDSEALQSTIRLTSYQSEDKILNQENDILAFDCEHQEFGLHYRIQSLIQDHKRLIHNYTVDAKQNDLIDYEKNQLILQKQSIALDTNMIQMEKEKLTIQENHLNKDSESIRSLQERVFQKRESVSKTQNELNKMANQSNEQTSAIESLFSKDRKYVVGLSDDEMIYAKQSFENEKGYMNDFINILNETKKHKELDICFQNRVEYISKKSSDFIIGEYKKINDFKDQEEKIKIGGKSIEGNNVGRTILLSENEMESYFRGIPELIQSKRIISEYANKKLLLMKMKRQKLADIVGNVGSSDFSFYRNIDQFENALRIMDDKWISNNSKEVFTGYFTVRIPPDSLFFKELLTKGKTTFEISRSITENKMKKYGYKIIGDDDVSALSSVHLIDMVASTSIETDAKLNSKRLILKTFGDGLFFEKEQGIEIPYIYSGKSKSIPVAVFDKKDSIIDQIKRHWDSRYYPCVLEDKSINSPLNDRGNVLKLMGEPLFAKYELSAFNINGFEKNGIELTFIYSYGM